MLVWNSTGLYGMPVSIRFEYWELIEMLDLADCKGVYVDEIAPNNGSCLLTTLPCVRMQ